MLDHFQLKGNSRLLHPHTDTDPADEDKSAARNRINTLVCSRTANLISTLQPCMSLSPYSLSVTTNIGGVHHIRVNSGISVVKRYIYCGILARPQLKAVVILKHKNPLRPVMREPIHGS